MSRKGSVTVIASVTVVYLALFAVTFWILMPLQAEIAEKFITSGKITTLLVLPHGFRVILTWLWRGRAVVFLLPGTAIQSLIIVECFGLGPQEWIALVLSYSCCSFAAFEIVKWFGVDAYASHDNPANWRTVLMVGALAGLINGVVNMQFAFGHFPMETQLWIALNLFIGGMTGLVAWLFFMRFALRRLAKRALVLS